MYLIDSNRYRRRIIGSPVREGKHWLESSRSHLASVESGGSISCPGSIKSTSMMNRGDPNCRDGASTHPFNRDLRPKAQHGQSGISREGGGDCGKWTLPVRRQSIEGDLTDLHRELVVFRYLFQMVVFGWRGDLDASVGVRPPVCEYSGTLGSVAGCRVREG